MDKNIKVKISDNTHDKASEVSNFSIKYSARKIDNSIASHEILTALKAEDNIIIEVNSSLLSLSEDDSKIFFSELIASLEKMKIEYTKKKIMVNIKRSLLSIGLEGKKREGVELFAYIPNEIWNNQEFLKLLTEVGVRYYLPKLCFENNLDAFINLDEDEKLEQCRMVIFDHILLGSMGINTSMFEKNQIMELLNK